MRITNELYRNNTRNQKINFCGEDKSLTPLQIINNWSSAGSPPKTYQNITDIPKKDKRVLLRDFKKGIKTHQKYIRWVRKSFPSAGYDEGMIKKSLQELKNTIQAIRESMPKWKLFK